jgi:hypothetical protein
VDELGDDDSNRIGNFAIWWVAFFPIIGLVAITLIFRIGKNDATSIRFVL